MFNLLGHVLMGPVFVICLIKFIEASQVLLEETEIMGSSWKERYERNKSETHTILVTGTMLLGYLISLLVCALC